jgi:hypothetical protein
MIGIKSSKGKQNKFAENGDYPPQVMETRPEHGGKSGSKTALIESKEYNARGE